MMPVLKDNCVNEPEKREGMVWWLRLLVRTWEVSFFHHLLKYQTDQVFSSLCLTLRSPPYIPVIKINSIRLIHL